MMSVIAFSAFSPSFSQNQIFIYFNGGTVTPRAESTVTGHTGETEILSVSNAFSKTFSYSSGQLVADAAKTTFTDIKFTKMPGRASGDLLLNFLRGYKINTVEIRYYTVVNLKPVIYLKIRLDNVYVSEFEENGKKNELPTDSISLFYERITYENYAPDAAGVYQLVSTTGWNRATNSPL